jgi:hypothetical protein
MPASSFELNANLKKPVATVAPVKRAVVQKLRASPALVAAIAGGIHEGIAPRKVRYPFIVYTLVSSAYSRQWGGVILKALFDVSVFAENPVDANNIDALIAGALNEAGLNIDGQNSLLCRRVADLPTGPDIDSEGKRIYQVGGSYSIWTDQSLGA